MGLLTNKEREQLIDLLLKLPNIVDSAVRNQLLPGLPRDLQVQIVNPGAPKPHLINIINTIDNDFMDEPYEDGWPALQLIENAMFLVGQQSPIGYQLKLLLIHLQERAERLGSPLATQGSSPWTPPPHEEEYKRGLTKPVSPRIQERDKKSHTSPDQDVSYGMGNRWAVLIGINYYEDKNNYGQLNVSVKDVNAIYNQLIAGGFAQDRIHLLTDDTIGELPTRNNILSILSTVAKATETDDTLLFYFSGHGDEYGKSNYLVPRDGRAEPLKLTTVPISEVKGILQKAPAHAKIIILDACHAGVNIRKKGPKHMSAGFIRRVFENAAGLVIIASCEKGEFSYELLTGEHSSFTHFLLEALQGKADYDRKGFVTIQDINRYVSDKVKLWASRNKLTQTPTFESKVEGDIILCDYSPQST